MRALVVIAILLGLSTERADACACCDATTWRKPIGWSTAGGALLVDSYTDVACERRRTLEIWPVGATQPSACYDLYHDPEKRIACDQVPYLEDWKTKPKTSSKVKLFPRAPIQIDAAKLRVRKALAKDVDGNTVGIRVAVDIDNKQVSSEQLDVGHTASLPSVGVSVWPNARNDIAMLLVSYNESGTGNEVVLVRWVEPPK